VVKEKLDPPPSYDNQDLPHQLCCVLEPSTFHKEEYYRHTVYTRLHTFAPYGIEFVNAVYQEEQLRLYSKGNEPHLIALIQFAYRERRYLLQGIGPRHVSTWIPQTTDFRLIIAKIMRSTLPEYFGKTLLPLLTYRILTVEEYVRNEFYSDLPQ
jgi:hypothetical protein